VSVPIGNTGISIGGRAGYRYEYRWAMTNNAEGFGLGTVYLGAGASWQLGRLQPFARVQWEYANPTTDFRSWNGKVLRDAVYLVGVLDYRLTDSLAAGLQAMTQEANPTVTNRQAELLLRYYF
jgi:hypothetical protein